MQLCMRSQQSAQRSTKPKYKTRSLCVHTSWHTAQNSQRQPDTDFVTTSQQSAAACLCVPQQIYSITPAGLSDRRPAAVFYACLCFSVASCRLNAMGSKVVVLCGFGLGGA